MLSSLTILDHWCRRGCRISSNYNDTNFVDFLAAEDSLYESFGASSIRWTGEEVDYYCDRTREHAQFREVYTFPISNKLFKWCIGEMYIRQSA